MPLSSAASSQRMLASGSTLQQRKMIISATACVTTAVSFALSMINWRRSRTPVLKMFSRSCLAQSSAARPVEVPSLAYQRSSLQLARALTEPGMSLLLVNVVSWQGSSLAETKTDWAVCFNIFGLAIDEAVFRKLLAVWTSFNHCSIEPFISC